MRAALKLLLLGLLAGATLVHAFTCPSNMRPVTGRKEWHTAKSLGNSAFAQAAFKANAAYPKFIEKGGFSKWQIGQQKGAARRPGQVLDCQVLAAPHPAAARCLLPMPMPLPAPSDLLAAPTPTRVPLDPS